MQIGHKSESARDAAVFLFTLSYVRCFSNRAKAKVSRVYEAPLSYFAHAQMSWFASTLDAVLKTKIQKSGFRI